MVLTMEEILVKLLVPMGNEWEVDHVDYSECNFMIRVYLRYTRDTVFVGGKELKIWDYRPEREWRHLDMWQCQTFIHASIPRYKDAEGKPQSVEVPWAESRNRITDLLKKSNRDTTGDEEPVGYLTALEDRAFNHTPGHGASC